MVIDLAKWLKQQPYTKEHSDEVERYMECAIRAFHESEDSWKMYAALEEWQKKYDLDIE